MRTRRRIGLRTGTLIALGAVVWLGATQDAPVQQTESETVARYRQAAESSDRPIDHYNLGTALLLEGKVTEAQAPLQQSLRAEENAVRESGHYNYGLSTAFDGRFAQQDPTARKSALVAARQAFREVLRSRPDDADARWNLELVERWLEEESQSGGDGSQGGQSDSQGGAGAGGAPAGGQGEQQMLSPEEAAALLDQAGEAEASIRDRVMGRNRFKEPVVERNW